MNSTTRETTQNNGDSMGSEQQKLKVQAPAGTNSQSATSTAVVAQSLSRTSNAPLKFPCRFPGCNHAFATVGQLDQHIKAHSEQVRTRALRVFKCLHFGCERHQYASEEQFNKHNSKYHAVGDRKEKEERMFQCTHPGCPRSFTTQKGMRRHLDNHKAMIKKEEPGEQKMEIEDEKMDTFQCTHPGCSISFTTQKGMKLHSDNHKAMIKKEELGEQKMEMKDEKRDTHKCTFPGCQSRSFGTAEYLHRHVLGKHPQLHREVVAAEEPKPGAQIPDQEPEEMMEEDAKLFSCRIPGCKHDGFATVEQLNEHIKTHSEQIKTSAVRVFRCVHSGCSRYFATHLGMRRHLACHKPMIKKEVVEEQKMKMEDEKRDTFKCAVPRCPNRVFNSIELLYHHILKTHPEVQRALAPAEQFKCTHPGCTSSFPKHHGMRIHLATHKVTIKKEVVEEAEPDAVKQEPE